MFWTTTKKDKEMDKLFIKFIVSLETVIVWEKKNYVNENKKKKEIRKWKKPKSFLCQKKLNEETNKNGDVLNTHKWMMNDNRFSVLICLQQFDPALKKKKNKTK